MKTTSKLATARTPDGSEMVLYQHDRDFSIMINGEDLMHSRQHESELALARLGCAHLAGNQAPSVLIGGLGMGYTLRQALDMLGSRARVVVNCSVPLLNGIVTFLESSMDSRWKTHVLSSRQVISSNLSHRPKTNLMRSCWMSTTAPTR